MTDIPEDVMQQTRRFVEQNPLMIAIMAEVRDKALEDAAVVADEWAHDAETADADDEWYMGCAAACRSFASKIRAMKSTGREDKP